MIGYSPVELAIRATLGKPPDTGADGQLNGAVADH